MYDVAPDLHSAHIHCCNSWRLLILLNSRIQHVAKTRFSLKAVCPIIPALSEGLTEERI